MKIGYSIYTLLYIYIFLFSAFFTYQSMSYAQDMIFLAALLYIRINFYFCHHRVVGTHLVIIVVIVNGAFELERLKFSKLNVSKRFLPLLLLLPMVKCSEIAEMLLSTLYNRIYCLKQCTYDANIKHPLSWNKGKGTYF